MILCFLFLSSVYNIAAQKFNLANYDSILTEIADLPSLDSCISIALDYDPNLRQNSLEARLNDAEIRNNKTDWLDYFNLVASTGYGNNFLDFNNSSILISSPQASPNFSISLNYNIALSRVKRARIKSVSDKLDRQIILESRKDIKRLLIENVSRMYYEIKINAKEFEFLLLNVESEASKMKVTTQQFNHGDIEYKDFLIEKQQLLSFQNRIEVIYIQLSQQLFNLKNTIGLIQY